tara:strand:- start:146 stop:745 length:600 start_codon:yes stop_codon:yes gene_type:complete
MELNYTFDTRKNDSQNYYYYNEGFSKEELNKIEKNVADLPWNIADTAGGDNTENRRSKVKWVPQNGDWWWLYEKLANMAVEANNANWNFDLHSLPEQIQYTEYYGTDKGHYGWHADIGPDILSTRKISITVQLSEADEYEGGDLQLFRGGNYEAGEFDTAYRGAGSVFIFPSYILHRVTPVTKGTRKSFVLWLGGGHYR